MNRALRKEPLHFHLPENVGDALRNTAVIILPLLLWYRQAPELTSGVATGVLIVSLTDIPGNRHQKIRTAWQSVLVAAIVSVIFNSGLAYPLATGLVLCVFSFLLSLSNGFGPAAGAVGMSGVALMIFMLGLRPAHPLQFSAYMVLGAVLFHGVVLLQTYLLPFRSLRQELQELLKLTAEFLSARADCYDPNVPLEKAYEQTMRLHLRIMAKQEGVRQLLLTDRAAMQQTDDNVRQLLSTAIITIQLYEHFIATPLDHGEMRETLKTSGALNQVAALIRHQADTIGMLAKQLPFGKTSLKNADSSPVINTLENLAAQCNPEQTELVNAVLKNADAVRALIITMATPNASAVNLTTEELQRFLPDSKSFRSTLTAQLHWRSPSLRFSLRLAIMLTIAYCAVYAFSTDHYNYWFLLTIMVVSRPRVAVTWQRNLERLIGTVAGLAVAYALLASITSPAILLSIAAVFLTVFYALNRTRYDRSVFAITICAVLFASVYGGGSAGVLYARLLYTFAGCALAMAGIFVFPVWVKAQLDLLAKAAISGNAKLLNAVILEDNDINIRLARKEAHQHIAYFFEGLKHAQYEPGVKHLAGLKQILLLNYRLNSVILSLFLFEQANVDIMTLKGVFNSLEQAEQEFSFQSSAPAITEGNYAERTLLETLTADLLYKIRAYNANKNTAART